VRLLKFPLFAGLVMIAAYSCREKGSRFIDHGEIHYNIDYVHTSGSMSNDFKPHTLVVSFNSNKLLFEILSPIANQGIINIINPEENIYDTYINMLGVKYYYRGAPGEIHPGFGSMTEPEIKKTSKTKNICGFSCKNAEVTFADNRKKIYEIWYTNDIDVKNTNTSTPFESIDGVLMSFYYILGDTELRFDAETVYKKDIPDKAFERRPKFKLVSRKDMDKIIIDMVNL
jgi:hypothetical protein